MESGFETLTIADAARLIADREVSPVELTRSFLDRVEILDGRLNSYVLVLRDQAMDTARHAEAEIVAGRYRGPLHGIPMGLKDIIDTRGVATTTCSRLRAENIPESNAEAWRRLEAVGAVMIRCR